MTRASTKGTAKRALIVGSDGQDGRILAQCFQRRNIPYLGVGRGTTKGFEIQWDGTADITRYEHVVRLIQKVAPDEIYYLAAYHHSSEDVLRDPLETERSSYQVNTLGFIHFLEAVHKHRPEAKIFYAASSLIFGDGTGSPLDEESPLNPTTSYGVAKAASVFHSRAYRKKGVFVSNGILFNHESCYRAGKFLSSKVIQAALSIKNGSRAPLTLGDLSALVDWGYAPDFVEAFQRVLELKDPGDFVIATGTAHSVQEFVEIAFSALELNWRDHVKEDSSVISRKLPPLIGNSGKLTRLTGWRPSHTFEEMVRLLVSEHAKRTSGET